MTVEVANNIAELNELLPDDTGTANEGELLEDPAHTRLIKDVLKKVFKGVDGTGFNRAIFALESEINHVTGLAAALQVQLTAALKTSVPIGGVIMYSGVFNNIPANYSLCTGGGGTPNLTSDFVYGTNIEAQLETTGGTNNAIAPSHTHTAYHGHADVASSSDGGHFHDIRYSENLNGTDIDRLATMPSSSTPYTMPINSEGDHIHSVTIDTAFVTTTTEGESGTDKNIPPYLQLAFIQRMS